MRKQEMGMGKTKGTEAAGRKKRTGWKALCGIVAALLLFFAVISGIPPKPVMDRNPFIKAEGALPMIAAHRGGGVSNPENTLMAFRPENPQRRINAACPR